MNTDHSRALSALNAISPDVSHDEWVRVGMAMQAAGLTFDDFDAWSSSGASYSEQAARAAWRGFRPDGGIGAGTLFHIAKEHGWHGGINGTVPARSVQAAPRARKPHVPCESPDAVWVRCEPATHAHSYIMRKGAHGVPLDDLRVLPAGDSLKIMGEPMAGALVMAVRLADRSIATLQFIPPPEVVERLKARGKSGKLNLPGYHLKDGWFTVPAPSSGGTIYVNEGIGGAWSCRKAKGAMSVATCGSGRMDAVATQLRQRDPAALLVLVLDRGKEQEGDAIARKVGALVVHMPEGEAWNFDANDFAQREGDDALAELLEHAYNPAQVPWPEPQPLIAKIEPEPYPLDALPQTVCNAVQEVADFVKAPTPLLAVSALAAMSLAVQAQCDVQRAQRLAGPCSVFALVIADSGERKTTCDGFFTKAIREYEARQQQDAQPKLEAYRSDHDAWEAKRAGIKEQIKDAARKGQPSKTQEQGLRALDMDEPKAPRVPRLIYGDATPEALAHSLAKNWPCGGVISSEAGSVFGSHGMGKESIMRNLSMLNVLWDGGELPIDRRTSDSFIARGVRLTMALQVQEATLRAFFDSTKGLARGTGFLARFLIAWPMSTQGMRPFTEAPSNWPALAAFNSRLEAILKQPPPVREDGSLAPDMLTMSPEAKAAWVAFHDAVEGELRTGGELYDVRDAASKIADNAARLAALFHAFEGGIGPICFEALESGARIAAWHLNESRRFFGELAMPAEVARPMRLEAWLLDYCRRERTDKVPTREIQRCGPNGLRDKTALAEAVKELEELGRARIVQDGKKKLVQINPALLARASS